MTTMFSMHITLSRTSTATHPRTALSFVYICSALLFPCQSVDQKVTPDNRLRQLWPQNIILGCACRHAPAGELQQQPSLPAERHAAAHAAAGVLQRPRQRLLLHPRLLLRGRHPHPVRLLRPQGLHLGGELAVYVSTPQEINPQYISHYSVPSRECLPSETSMLLLFA